MIMIILCRSCTNIQVARPSLPGAEQSNLNYDSESSESTVRACRLVALATRPAPLGSGGHRDSWLELRRAAPPPGGDARTRSRPEIQMGLKFGRRVAAVTGLCGHGKGSQDSYQKNLPCKLAGTLVHPNSYMNSSSWNIWFIYEKIIWIHTSLYEFIHEFIYVNSYTYEFTSSLYEFIYEMIIWIHIHLNSYMTQWNE